MKRVTATINCHHVIHARPAALLVKIGRRFPDTQIRLIKGAAHDSINAELEILSLMMAEITDGDVIVIEADGASEVLAVELFRVALENFKDPTQVHLQEGLIDYKAVEQITFAAIDDAFFRFADECPGSVSLLPDVFDGNVVQERRFAYLNDRLHNLTVPVLPAIAWHYKCTIELRFETKSGIHVCKLEPDSDELVINPILVAAPDAGTRITIVVTGERRDEAGRATQSVLNNLRQCDEWLRQRNANLKREDLVSGLLAYAITIEQLQQQAAPSRRNVEIGKLLNEESVIVYLPTSSLSKEEILHQLVAVQTARFATLVEEQVLESVWRRERIEPVILREGLALPHAAVQYGPRIAISIAIIPKGVDWDSKKPPVQVVFLFVYADDTERTYLEHMAQLAAIFKQDQMLQQSLICSKNAREVIRLIRQGEDSISQDRGLRV